VQLLQRFCGAAYLLSGAAAARAWCIYCTAYVLECNCCICFVMQLLHLICWCPGAGPTALRLRLVYSTSYFYGAGSVADSDGSTAIPLMLSL
jgi:hypothetical protein